MVVEYPAANTSVNDAEDDKDRFQLYANVGYVLSGIATVLSQLAMIGAILLSRQLRRKELLILAGVAAGDLIYGAGFIIGGARRVYLLTNGRHRELVSVWTCQLEPGTFFNVFGPQLASLMSLALAVDRLLTVVAFRIYERLTLSYSYAVTGAVGLAVTASYLTGVTMAYLTDNDRQVSIMCLTSQASWPIYGQFYTNMIAASNLLTLLVFAVVVLLLRYYNKAKHALSSVQERRQNRMTRILALAALCDLCLDAVPWAIQITCNNIQMDKYISFQISQLCWIIVQFDRTVNFLIYLRFFVDIRNVLIDGMLAVFKRSTVAPEKS